MRAGTNYFLFFLIFLDSHVIPETHRQHSVQDQGTSNSRRAYQEQPKKLVKKPSTRQRQGRTLPAVPEDPHIELSVIHSNSEGIEYYCYLS